MLTLLLPARNAAADLPGYLESAAAYADRVIALDDGSTDSTLEQLEASRLVTTVLRSPRRESYAGWDDAANRQRLLDAAIEAGAGWVLFLDADERIDPDDGAALRDFLARDAIAGCAYGVQLFRDWGQGHCEAAASYVFRLFEAAPGQRLAEHRLHFNPVPREIDPALWVRTTIRARHLDSAERIAARRLKYAEADERAEHSAFGARWLDEPAGEIVPWQQRPPKLTALAVDRGLAPVAPVNAKATLTLLLPARNAAADLPGYLESAAAYADRVIALDDGSTDSTLEQLEASRLVTTVLRSPRRESYAGWDDAANRQRLLDAAIEAGAGWVLFLDADERIDPDDGAALRDFLARDAIAGCAYGFRVFRMIGDERHFDRASLWVYRLFEAEPGQRLSGDRLHLVPVPESIPRRHWLRTTVRIAHLASLDASRRFERAAKYRLADPDREWQGDYSRLESLDDRLRDWAPRPPGLPVLTDPLGVGGDLDLLELEGEAPALSAIVISRNDVATIERSVLSVVSQQLDEPFEVIVAASGDDGTADLVRQRFPDVQVVDVAEPGLPGAARNAGLELARGAVISFPGSHVELPPGSLAERLRAHRRGYSMVTGSVLNANRTPSGWASYFLDHSGSLPGRTSAELGTAPAHCSYTREALLEVGGFAPDVRTAEDTLVNEELWRRGHRALRWQPLRLSHRSPCSTPPALVAHHFRRGRGYGRILLASGAGRWVLLRFLGRYPRWRMRRTAERVRRWGGELGERFSEVRGLVALGVLAAAAGAGFEVLTGSGDDSGRLQQLADRDEREPLLDEDLDDESQRREHGRGVVHVM